MKIEIPGKTNKQIAKLVLSDKNLSQIPEDIFEFTNLRKLDLSNNLISTIPTKILKLKKLKVLILKNNKLAQLQTAVFKLPKLQTLDVSKNELKTLPKQIRESPIINLIISHNQIKNLDFELLSNIEKLDISNNNIENIIISNENPIALENLRMGNNPIKHFSIPQHSIPSLKSLYTFGRKYYNQDIDSFVRKLTKLKGNQIDTIKSMNNNNLNASDYKEMNIFISYSHKDIKYLKLLQIHLKGLTRSYKNIQIWDDKQLKSGDHWKETIMDELQKSSVAIILVSAAYIASDFITNVELPPLLEKAEKDGTRILPIIVSPCKFDISPLQIFQAANDPKRTLLEMEDSERERQMVNIMDELESFLKK